MRFEYYIGSDYNPYHNFAMEEVLMRKVSNGTGILFLWQNDNTIVVGRNQDVYRECKAKDFVSEGGLVARRRSGGGAVYHDLGNLNYSLLVNDSEYKPLYLINIIIKALERLGIHSAYNGKNDIEIKGRKCSGNAMYYDGSNICQHGTLLIDTDIDKMMDVLTPEKRKLDRNHVASISSRVVNLKEISKGISVETMIRILIETVRATPLEIVPDLTDLISLISFYQSEKWVFGGVR